jgi:hypothetical protein
MRNRFEKMSKSDIVAAIKGCEQAVINLQKHTTDLEAGRGLPKDGASRAQLIESNAKNIDAKLSEMKNLNDELGRRAQDGK